MKMRNDYTCPLELTHDITKGKWKTIIIGSWAEAQRRSLWQSSIET